MSFFAVVKRIYSGSGALIDFFTTDELFLTDAFLTDRELSSFFSGCSSSEKHDLYRPHKAIRRPSTGPIGQRFLQSGAVELEAFEGCMFCIQQLTVSLIQSVKKTSKVYIFKMKDSI